MASIRSTITLIDNFSATMSRFVGGSNKVTESTVQMQEQLSKGTDFTDKLLRLQDMEAVLIAQQEQRVRVHERLVQKYEEQVAVSGRYSDAAEKILEKVLASELAMYKGSNAVEKATANVEKLKQQTEKVELPIKKSTKQQSALNQEIRRGTSATGGLIHKVKGLVAAYLGFRGAKKGFETTVGAFAHLNQQTMMMQAAFGNTDIGASYFNDLQKYAVKTGQKLEDLSEVTRNFMQVTKNTDKLRGLTDIANRMSLRTSNIGSAEVLMQEAMRGQYTRLQRTLHLTDAQIEPLKRAVQAGSLEGIIGAFDQALNTAGLTNEIVEAFQASPLQKFNRILASFKQRLARAGEQALERLTPLLERVDRWLQSDSATKFFNSISLGVTGIVETLTFLFGMVQRYWPVILAGLIFLSSVVLAKMIHQLWLTIPPLQAQAIAWMAPLWPILAILAAIGLFIFILIRLGIKAEEITGFIGGLFGILWANIHNGIAFAWNATASFAEFIANIFIDPVYAVQKLFHDVFTNILRVFDSMLQGVLKGINWIIDQSNKFLKTNFEQVEIDFVTKAIADLEAKAPTSEKDVWKAQRMEYKDYAVEFAKGYDLGKLLPDKINEGINSVTDAINNLSATEALWNAKQLDMLGSIDGNTKQLTEEDLKWLRDSAEQDTINRFTAATLAPQISLQFGDIRETADVDGIVDHVQKVLTELLNTTAEGVHV